MTETFYLTDEIFYALLDSDSKEYFKGFKEAVENGLIPYVKVLQNGHRSSWYNKHIGKSYEIHKFIMDTENGYVNYLVKSKGDGTKMGYKPQFSSLHFGKGLDMVHSISAEISFALLNPSK